MKLKNRGDKRNLQGSKLNYKFYFGIPHCHTSLSTGKGSVVEACEYARKKCLDFIIITDHGKIIGDKKYENSNWSLTEKYIKKTNNKYKDFLVIRGFELGTKPWGHMNIINSHGVISEKVRDLNKLLNWFNNEDKSVLVAINHPGSDILKLKYDKALDKYINFIEVGNGSFPYAYNRYEKYYYKLLDMGWHLGSINGQDNHSFNWGDADNLTVILSEELTVKAILKALKNRRTYSTETRTLRLSFKCNNTIMGSVLKIGEGKELYFEVEAFDKDTTIKKLQIITNGGVIFKEKIFNSNKILWNTVEKANYENKWYVIKVIQDNDKQGMSSPIFIQYSN